MVTVTCTIWLETTFTVVIVAELKVRYPPLPGVVLHVEGLTVVKAVTAERFAGQVPYSTVTPVMVPTWVAVKLPASVNELPVWLESSRLGVLVSPVKHV